MVGRNCACLYAWTPPLTTTHSPTKPVPFALEMLTVAVPAEPVPNAVMLTSSTCAGANGSLCNGGIHLCRGNSGGQFHAEGGYDVVAEKLFNAIDLDLFYLEYDSDRAGGFEPLAAVPKDKSVVLGIVSTKTGALESAPAVRARINAAAKFMPLENLALSPQCGFASADIGNPLTQEEQEAKLKLVVDVAKDVWG